MPDASGIVPDGLREKANTGDLPALRALCECLAQQMLATDGDALPILDELEHYARWAAESGEHSDLGALVWTYSFRAGYCQGEREEPFAVADTLYLLDQLADRGFEDAAIALYVLGGIWIENGVGGDAFEMASAARSAVTARGG